MKPILDSNASIFLHNKKQDWKKVWKVTYNAADADGTQTHINTYQDTAYK